VDENLRKVIELQKLDLAIKELEESKSAVPKQIEDLVHELEASKTVLSEYRKKLETIDKSIRALEHDMSGNEEKRKKYEMQLYAVKSNREYTSLLNEIEEINKSNSLVEEQVISTMEERDDLRKTLALKEAEFKEEVKVHENQKGDRNADLEQISQQLKDHRERRKLLLEGIDPVLASRYSKIAKARHNAVVPINAGACSGCYMKVRPQVLARARQSESIVICDNCNRILYYEEAKEE
jgi:uncharacterized protein